MNVTTDMARFKMTVGGWVVILALDLLVALGIHRSSRKKDRKLAMMTGGTRLLYSVVLGFGVVQLLGIPAARTGAAIHHGLESFNHLWGIGLILFGLHLIALAFLFRRNAHEGWVEFAIFLLLLLAGVGYVVQYAGMLMVSNPVAFVAFIEPIFIAPMMLGELAYAIWMLVKEGRRSSNSHKGIG